MITEYDSLDWASRTLNLEEFCRVAKLEGGQCAPAGEYLDGQTGELIVVGDAGQIVPPGTVYLSLDSLRDQGIENI